MTEFWDQLFKSNQALWGFEPSPTTVLTHALFVNNKAQNVLIPGIGYARNAQIFKESGMTVTGIEISQTAIDLAHKHYGDDLMIHHGSVTEMPFDDNLYEGIYSYALIQLLDKNERQKFIQDCFNQLSDNGQMVFATVTKQAPLYGQGLGIGQDRFELSPGLTMFFYDRETIQDEFAQAGLYEVTEVTDIYPFYLIKCKK